MEFVFAKINVPHEHSFITRRLLLSEDNPKIHSHNNYELNLIISGSGRRIVGNNISCFEAGDLVLLGPNLPHCWEVLDRQDDLPPACIVIHFDENIVGSDFFNLPELESVKELLNRGNYGLFFKGDKVDRVIECMERLVNLKGLESYIELLHIFKWLIEIDDKETLSLTPEYPTSYFKNLGQIKDVYEYVFHNIQDGISLKAASDLLNMAPGSFCRYFKKRTGKTFIQYVKEIRISIASKKLAESDKPISQICYDSGYNNLANFNLYFKDIMHMTPSEYRKNFR
jgi:AraC-like DNA-binding protein